MAVEFGSPRPTKRVRFEEPGAMEQITDDVDDLYGDSDNKALQPSPLDHTQQLSSVHDQNAAADACGIPGLGLLNGAPQRQPSFANESATRTESDHLTTHVAHDDKRLPLARAEVLTASGDVVSLNDLEGPVEVTPSDFTGANAQHGLADAAQPDQEHSNVTGTLYHTNAAVIDPLFQEPTSASVEHKGDVLMGEEKEGHPIIDERIAATQPNDPIQSQGENTSSNLPDSANIEQASTAILGPAETTESLQPKHDAEFLAAAENNKGDANAEWNFDSSDADSTSDSSSDSSSDDDSDDDSDMELMDPETAVRMLMAEGGDEDGGPSKGNANSQPRTKNEKPAPVIPKPDVTVTPEMKITLLGIVESVVETMLLVTATTTGGPKVLEQGSVLCLGNRLVFGAVAETLGRVQNPLYTVAFNDAQEISDAGISKGTEVFYVDDHSTFVFTEPLKAMKYTDASNDWDEEVNEDDMEFSDDEAEAAYKRSKKDAKRARQGGGQSRQPAEDGSYARNEPINYDDVGGDEMYTPLSRPANLQNMTASGPPVPGQRAPRPGFDRGRGRGGRDRGDRGRGDRGRGDRGRGGRGNRGHGENTRGRGGPAQASYGSQNNMQGSVMAYQPNPYSQAPQQQAPQQQQHKYQQTPLYGQQQAPSYQQYQPQSVAPSVTPTPQNPYAQAWAQYLQTQQQQTQQQLPTPSPSTQHYANSYAPATSTQSPVQLQPGAQQYGEQTTSAAVPAGAFVNPNFFGAQQGQQYNGQAGVQGQHGGYGNAGPSGAQVPNAALQAMQQQMEYWRRVNGST